MSEGTTISMTPQGLRVPNDPIIPHIIGDGSGPDIWAAAKRVIDAAVAAAYGSARRIAWKEVLAGQKAHDTVGSWLPEETMEAFRRYLVGIKGPLTTPVGGGIRSLNVALRQGLDLYACVRPVRYFKGIETPVKEPGKVNMIIFRENTEDIYAGIEFQSGSKEAQTFFAWLTDTYPARADKVRFPGTSGFGIKPVSKEGTQRLVRAAIKHAVENNCPFVTLVHKGNIMKFTEGAFRDWGYEVARSEFGGVPIGEGPWCRLPNGTVVKDCICDAFLQEILIHPQEHSVVATLNLNGDYCSDALAAQVGGIGIAPGANINYRTGHAVFEATHGTAPKLAGLNKVNPCSFLLSAEMMLRYIGWGEAADRIVSAIEAAISAKTVTADLAEMIPGSTALSTSAFGDALLAHLK
ncbi:MAG: NADP-dependent isocitrate dehydrogenase [Akkermansia muciniphila]|nr:NADP-dependent isocitrate dehydrogenase [Akkermansia muciniphila]